MRPRDEYQVTIEYFIPKRDIPGTGDQIWDYLMAIFTDVATKYPDAGTTVTRCGCAVLPNGKPLCPASCTPRLEVHGTERAPVEALMKQSEEAHRFW